MRRTVEGNRNHREREGKPARVRKKRQAKHAHAQADLGYMYTWDDWSDDWVLNPPHWSAHRITKITKKRIFVHDEGERQLSFDRATVERDGFVANCGDRSGASSFGFAFARPLSAPLLLLLRDTQLKPGSMWPCSYGRPSFYY